MSILLYCIAKSGLEIENSIAGVAGSTVIREDVGVLAVFTSRNSESSTWLRQPVRASAIEFNRVLKQVFNSAAIIPFRFPTIFKEHDELTAHVKQRGAEYDALLTKFADVVQMELRITYVGRRQTAGSGTNYLRNRRDSISAAEHAARTLRQSLSRGTEGWLERELKDGVRAFALVKRGAIAEFENAMRKANIPDGFNVRVSGPWPVSEFLEIR